MLHDKNADSRNYKVKIVFVQDHFFLGGVEILEIKLVEELSRQGYNVVIASRENKELDTSCGNFTRFIHKGYPDFISRATNLASDGTSKIIFASLHPTAAMASEIAGRAIIHKYNGSIPVHHFHWVSHSRAFFFSKNSLGQKLFEKFFELLPVKSTFFMNDAALFAHQAFWEKSLEVYPIMRIVGRNAKAKHTVGKGRKDSGEQCQKSELRIVSVGRLVPFKSYNVNAPIIIKRLRDAGIKASWDIWGYGPEEPAIISNAKHYDVTRHVRLLGALPHAKFDETVSAYDIFVGMGTSVLEAANTGMPVCVAVENQADACYGYLHEAPSDSVGDRVEGFPERKLNEVLHAFALLNPEERAKIGASDAAAARQRESTLDKFATEILSAEPMRHIGWSERALLSAVKAYLMAQRWKLERGKS